MTGILVINHFLTSNKFDVLHNHLVESAKKQGINLLVKTNLEMAIKPEISDFVLFWDKDIRLAKSLEKAGTPVFNSSESIRLSDDKALTYLELDGIVNQPKTMIAPLTFFENSSFLPFVEKAIEVLSLPLVFKECFGSFGEQVFLCKTKEEILLHITSKPFILQEFIKSSKGTDIRLEIVDGVCVAAVRRENKNDFRANVTNGGKMTNYNPTDEEIATAVKASNKLGLTFCGVDILNGNILCEVNSNAHIINIAECTGKDIAPIIFDSIREKIL